MSFDGAKVRCAKIENRLFVPITCHTQTYIRKVDLLTSYTTKKTMFSSHRTFFTSGGSTYFLHHQTDHRQQFSVAASGTPFLLLGMAVQRSIRMPGIEIEEVGHERVERFLPPAEYKSVREDLQGH